MNERLARRIVKKACGGLECTIIGREDERSDPSALSFDIAMDDYGFFIKFPNVLDQVMVKINNKRVAIGPTYIFDAVKREISMANPNFCELIRAAIFDYFRLFK